MREPLARLAGVDMRVVNGGRAERGEFFMELVGEELRALVGVERLGLESLRGRPVHAVAGIGDPGRFFAQLRRHGLEVIEHPYPDHHAYAAGELEFGDRLPVLMTENDELKYRRYARPGQWFLPVEARLGEAFRVRLLALLNSSIRSSRG